jgi:hypothetical protein
MRKEPSGETSLMARKPSNLILVGLVLSGLVAFVVASGFVAREMSRCDRRNETRSLLKNLGYCIRAYEETWDVYPEWFESESDWWLVFEGYVNGGGTDPPPPSVLEAYLRKEFHNYRMLNGAEMPSRLSILEDTIVFDVTTHAGERWVLERGGFVSEVTTTDPLVGLRLIDVEGPPE